MAKYDAKTKAQDGSVDEFLATVAPPERQADARRLDKIFEEVTGFPTQFRLCRAVVGMRAVTAALRRLIRAGLDALATRWPVTPA